MPTKNQCVEVYVNPAGDVCLAHRDMSEECVVAMPPEDVDGLIQDLRIEQAKAYAFRRLAPQEMPFTD